MKFNFPKQLFLLLFLVSFVACDNEEEPEEPKLPEVATTTSETQAVTTFTSVEITGAVDESNEEITSYGVVWATSANPTIEDHVALPGENSAQATSKNRYNRQSQNSDFTVKINNLAPGEMYYFRTFATNAAGTAYGEEIMLETQSLAGTTWELTMDLNIYPYIAHVTFYEDGTAFYTEPENPAMFDFWGLWEMENNHLTYQVRNDWDEYYVLQGDVQEKEISGTYNVFSAGAVEERTFTGEFLSIAEE